MQQYTRFNLVLAWLIHLFTASGAVWGVLAIRAISHQQLLPAFWYMALAVFIDAIDGTFARWVNSKQAVPHIDGALLDNIVDYLNYTIVPAYFVLETTLIASPLRTPVAAMILLTSAYQFTQADAKTADHFFKGFPSYWNLVICYMFLWGLRPTTNFAILLFLGVMVFVPIKYIYPSRLEYLTHSKILQQLMLAATILWGAASAGLLWVYPQANRPLTLFMIAFFLLYVLISVYRTFVPLPERVPL